MAEAKGRKVTLEDALASIDRLARVQEDFARTQEDLAKDMARTQEDLAKDMARSREDLAKTQKDLAKDMARTQEDLARTQKEERRKAAEERRKTEEHGRKIEAAMAEERRKTEEERRKTEKVMRETARFIKKVTGDYDNRWGDFMENLVRGDLVRLLGERGVAVGAGAAEGPLSAEDEDGNEAAEFDLWAGNEREAVLAEVKTTLRPEDVEGFAEKLGRARAWFPEKVGDRALYGVLAFLRAHGSVRTRAERLGLFLVESPGEGAGLSRVVNSAGFAPRKW